MFNLENFFSVINTNKNNIHSIVRIKKNRTQKNHSLRFLHPQLVCISFLLDAVFPSNSLNPYLLLLLL